MVDSRLFLLILGFSAFFVILTLILNHYIKKNKFIKYSPGVLSLAASLYYFYLSSKPSQGLQDLARLLMGVLFFIGFLAVLICGISIDIIKPKLKKIE